jgi:hypothetical protein
MGGRIRPTVQFYIALVLLCVAAVISTIIGTGVYFAYRLVVSMFS